MPSAYIVRRNNVKSTTYQVKYRLGGRSARIRHAGTFKTLREARARANWVRGEIAAMREPNLSFSSAQLDGITCGQAIQQMIDGRVDVSPNTLRSWSNCIPVAPKLRLSEFGVEQAQAWVTALSKKYATASVMVRISALTSALDYVGLDPNPLRSNRVKLPRREPVEALPVPNQHWDLLTQQLSPNNLAMARFLELTGIRRSEAGDLKWDAIDLAAGVVLIRKGKTKTARRILRLNDWSPEAWNLLKELAAASGTTGNVFPGTPENLSGQMARLSKKNKWPRYGPHALRHRRATLWINAGVPPREVAYRLGHQNTSTTLDTYTHRSLEAPECAEENSSS